MRVIDIICENSHPNTVQSRIEQHENYDRFVSSLDSVWTDLILYRGVHDEDDNMSDAFYTDYVSHAREYGDIVRAFVADSNDYIRITNDVFEKIRKTFSTEGAIDAAYASDQHYSDIDAAKNIINSEIPFDEVEQNYEITNALIPIFRAFALSRGKNGVVWTGGDYGEYGGQNEFYVIDHTKMKDLRDLHSKYWRQQRS